MDINITDLSGHTFTIKLNWDIGAMKDSISIYYDNKFKKDFLLENNLTSRDMINHLSDYFKSDYYKKANNSKPDNIQLIYKGEILEQFHIEADIYSYDDFKKDNNINVVIVKTDEIDDDDDEFVDDEFDDDYDGDYY